MDEARSASSASEFKGQLTYSSNWDHYTIDPVLEPARPDRDEQLLQARARTHDVTVDEIVGRWRDIQKDLFAFEQQVRTSR